MERFSALELRNPAERAAFLERECVEDLSLRARIERLLSAHGESKIFFADCVPALSPAESGDVGNVVPADEKLGGCIGPYKLLQKIGEGGCGLVYMAEQENLCPFRIDLYAGI